MTGVQTCALPICVLYSSGMIAGEGLIGIILAALAAGKKDIALSFTIGQPGALVVWILMLFGLYKISVGKKNDSNVNFNKKEAVKED